GRWLSATMMRALSSVEAESLPRVAGPVRLGACVAGVGKIVCVGLNYREHANELAMQTAKDPALFLKATSAIAGPSHERTLPEYVTKCDWEIELGVVIGSTAKCVTRERAPGCIAGFCIVNDISERALQLEGTGQWTKGKSLDGFAPIGPWLVTPEEVGNPQ